jgi:hypothetical protein
VGNADYYYVAGVSRRWRGRYIKLCYNGADPDEDEKLWTSYNRAIVTAARLQLALDNGLTVAELTTDHLAVDIVKCSAEPIAVLTLLELYDMQWSTELTTAAADVEELELLQWLHKYGCPWVLDEVADCAAWCDNADMLIWLRKVTCAWPQETLNKCMRIAGCANNLAGVQWLHKQGAEWPDRFILDSGTACWYPKAVQLALQNGADWGAWQCGGVAPDRFNCRGLNKLGKTVHDDAACKGPWCNSKIAEQLFKWAHENGCPCTCDADAAAAVVAV